MFSQHCHCSQQLPTYFPLREIKILVGIDRIIWVKGVISRKRWRSGNSLFFFNVRVGWNFLFTLRWLEKKIQRENFMRVLAPTIHNCVGNLVDTYVPWISSTVVSELKGVLALVLSKKHVTYNCVNIYENLVTTPKKKKMDTSRGKWKKRKKWDDAIIYVRIHEIIKVCKKHVKRNEYTSKTGQIFSQNRLFFYLMHE